jgi:hypothetical protein
MKFEISKFNMTIVDHSATDGRGTIRSSSSHAICAYDHTVPTSTRPTTSVHAGVSWVRRVRDIMLG